MLQTDSHKSMYLSQEGGLERQAGSVVLQTDSNKDCVQCCQIGWEIWPNLATLSVFLSGGGPWKERCVCVVWQTDSHKDCVPLSGGGR